MDDEGQKEYRSVVAKLNCVGYQSRPDVCFEAKALSTKFGKATKGDLKEAQLRMVKLKLGSTKMVFPHLGGLEDWIMVGLGDAGIKSMPDKATSVGGHVILMCNRKTNRCCVLLWRSKKIVRKVVSSLAGETLAMVATIGEMVYSQAILVEIFGRRVNEILKIVVMKRSSQLETLCPVSTMECAMLASSWRAVVK